LRGYTLKDLKITKNPAQQKESLKHILKDILPDLKKVETNIISSLDSSVQLAHDVSNYILGRGGKRIRPSILLLTSRLGSYEGTRAVILATAIEFIHTATLLHDDIIDNSSIRRGYPTANSRWGNEISVLIGDYLYTKAIGIFTNDNDPDLLSLLAHTTLRMIEGEIMQIGYKHDTSITEDKYFEIIRLKTSKLITAAAKIGAFLGSFSRQEVNIIGNFAEKMGIAFQLIDDTLDFIADEEGWGKPIGNDFMEGNLTLPIIRLLNVADDESREWMIQVIKQHNTEPETIERINNLFLEYEVFQYCFAKAEKLIEAGKHCILDFSDNSKFVSLFDLADFFIYRTC